ncbi:TonB-dependent receptor [Pseudoteredinibacter isoporae]|nr:TonB-dependent receptor [Pseudoteredinibacter isoporae]NHO89265.1 TonB-dependent receptor [Pseudoteredinibacter isoporae]NIB22372.1 TonB-dependent receptor [Pseudoteredinibacter isoporae]
MGPSSICIQAWRKFASQLSASSEADGLLRKILAACTIALLLLANPSAGSNNQELDKIHSFNIPAQRADRALTEFGRQADITIVFSFQATKPFKANTLRGRHSLRHGIHKLLKGSGLVARIGKSGQLSIDIQSQTERADTMKNNKTILAAAIASAISTTAVPSIAQDSNAEIEEVTVLGSRQAGRSAGDMPVPVDTLSSDALSNSGQTEVGRMLQALAPSFNFPSSSISDGTDALRPATLRGLGPDQTLVLVNGKRRHQASLIHINTSVGRGTAGVDMNAIPAASIKRIEVLRDGAAAQYGSDAIAGVINIVLKDDNEAGHIGISNGEYSEGDGNTTNIDFSKGFTLGDDGYLNISGNFRDREHTNRAGLHGSCQFSGCVDTDGNGILEAGDPREITAPRQTFRIGDAESEQTALTLNAGVEVGSGELYGFATYSSRDNESAAFFRHNANNGGNAPLSDGDATIPAGFLPKINSEIEDISVNIGYRMDFDSGATLDVSYTTGENTIDYTTSNSLNSSFANHLLNSTSMSDAEIRGSVPRTARAYGLELGLDTFNVDFTQSYGDLALAAGAAIRKDTYKVIPGEEYAYRDYDTQNGMSLYSTDRSGGIQGFPGIGPQSAVDEERDVNSLYLDGEYQVTDDLMVSAAMRYDDYDGFGNTVNYKLAGSFAASDSVRLRAAASTGFRAPSMQQLYFNNVSTQFVTDSNGNLVAAERGTFRNDSPVAKAIGIPALKEEESLNLSFGIVADLSDQLNVTIDFYQVQIDDRIVISRGLGTGLSPELDAALASAGASQAQFFLNGADTETKGVDIVASYEGIELGGGNLDITMAANYTKTDVTSLFTPANSGLSTLSTDQVFSSQDISIIEEWQPKDRISVSGLYTRDNWTVNLAFNRFGEYTIEDGGRQTYGAEILTDLRVAYHFDNGFGINFGGNNIFDVTPDENQIGNSRTGAIEDGPGGNLIVDSKGVFTYSRRSAPFGFNGAYYYLGVTYDF